MIASLDVLRLTNHSKSWVMTTMVARWKRFAEDHRYLVLCGVILVVGYLVDTGDFALLPRLILLGGVQYH